jgi:hypothetical protein
MLCDQILNIARLYIQVCGSSLLQTSEPSSLLLDDPASLAMRDPNWIALLGSLLAPWQPNMVAASLSSLFSPTPLGRPRSTYRQINEYTGWAHNI